MPEYSASFNLIHYFPAVTQIDGSLRTPLNAPFTIPGVASQLREASDTLFLNPALGKKIELNDRLLRATNFVRHPEWTAGREDSSQSIFFGDFTLVVDKGAQGENHTFPTAVKPYLETQNETDPWESALHEYIGCLLLNATNSIRTFMPIGIWVDERSKPFLLTHFEEEVVSLDNMSLLTAMESLPQDEAVVSALPLQFAADVLAMLHSQGFKHGDAQLKNFASDMLQGLVCDLVRLRRIVAPEEVAPDAESIRSQITYDLKLLIGSVVEQAYIPPESEIDMRHAVRENLVLPYLQKMLGALSSPIASLCCDGSVDLSAITDGLLDQI